MRRLARLRLPVATTLLVLALVAASCTDDDGTAPSPHERLTEIYAATITALVDEAGMTPAEDADSLTVYVAEREEAGIAAEVQVGVVGELEPWATVRFIDTIDEAVDRDAEGEPVRGDGVLIGLGPVSDGEATATLVADRYISAVETLVFDVAVTRRGGVWTVDTPLTGVQVPTP